RSDPVEVLHTGRDRNEEGQQGEEGQADGACREHVVRPYGHGQCADGDGGEDQTLVAPDRLAAEDRDYLGDDAEEGKRDDVDLWMAEEPEQVLPQDGAA